MKKTLLVLVALLFANISFAKSINLYEEPKTTSKIIGTLDTKVGVIMILTPEESVWSKVADPRDGKVGWVKTNDLGNSKIGSQVISSGDGCICTTLRSL